MHSKLTNISKEQIESIILPLLPKNKRGFKSRFKPSIRILFADIEQVKYEFSC